MTSFILIILAILVVWAGIGLQVKIVWKANAELGNGAFLRNHLNVESYLVGALWPILLPFILIIGTISVSAHFIHTLSSEPLEVNFND